jgi:hypothetical protein
MHMASDDNTIARTLHDLGLASWFGGSLMGRNRQELWIARAA